MTTTPRHTRETIQAAADNLRAKQNAERQRAYKARLKAQGLEQVSGWVLPHQVPEVQLLFKRLAADRDLTVGPVRNEATGRLEKLEPQT